MLEGAAAGLEINCTAVGEWGFSAQAEGLENQTTAVRAHLKSHSQAQARYINNHGYNCTPSGAACRRRPCGDNIVHKMPRFECAPHQASAGSACDIAVPNTDSAARARTAKLAHTRLSAFLLQPLLVPLPDVCKRSTLPEDALRAVVDSVGVTDWARCRFLSTTLQHHQIMTTQRCAAARQAICLTGLS